MNKYKLRFELLTIRWLRILKVKIHKLFLKKIANCELGIDKYQIHRETTDLNYDMKYNRLLGLQMKETMYTIDRIESIKKRKDKLKKLL